MNLTKINENFEINVIELTPEEYLKDMIDDTFVRISYKRKGSGHNPKPFILPRSVEFDESFTEAIGMYVGDGKLSKDLHHLDFTSKDTDIVKFMLDFFKKRLNLEPEDIRFTLSYRQLPEDSIDKWASEQEQELIVEGDSKYLAIAGASILAKVTHDRWITQFCEDHTDCNDQYDLLKSKGYGTAKHREGIRIYGAHELHRVLYIQNWLPGSTRQVKPKKKDGSKKDPNQCLIKFS